MQRSHLATAAARRQRLQTLLKKKSYPDAAKKMRISLSSAYRLVPVRKVRFAPDAATIKMLQQWQSGMAVTAIARKWGLKWPGSVKKRLRKLDPNITFDRRPLDPTFAVPTPEEARLIVFARSLYAEGKNLRQIATQIGRPLSWVYKRVHTRTRTEMRRKRLGYPKMDNTHASQQQH